MNIKQVILKRNRYTDDTISQSEYEILAYNGLLDPDKLYFVRDDESFEDFVNRVAKEANRYSGKIIRVSYPDRDTAVIVWEESSIKYKEIKMCRTENQQYEDFILKVYSQATLFPNAIVTFCGDEAIIKYEV